MRIVGGKTSVVITGGMLWNIRANFAYYKTESYFNYFVFYKHCSFYLLTLLTYFGRLNKQVSSLLVAGISKVMDSTFSGKLSEGTPRTFSLDVYQKLLEL